MFHFNIREREKNSLAKKMFLEKFFLKKFSSRKHFGEETDSEPIERKARKKEKFYPHKRENKRGRKRSEREIR